MEEAKRARKAETPKQPSLQPKVRRAVFLSQSQISLQASGAQVAIKVEQISLSQEDLARLLTQKYIDTYGHHPFTETGEETPASNLAQTGARAEGPGIFVY
jgi:hypothetical protein